MCPPHDVSEAGASACTECAVANGFTSNANHTACSECLPTYFMDLAANLCVLCPKGASCEQKGVTTTSLPLKDGYWRASTDTAVLHECPIEAGCSHRDDGQLCAPEYEGIMCAICMSGH